MKQFFAAALEIVEMAIIAIVAVFVVRAFLVQPFLVSGASMEPNFSNGDYLVIDELTYRFREPARGETIVFRYPGNESTYYIKRIIGLPGERVTVKDGAISVYSGVSKDGLRVPENYLPVGLKTSGDLDVTLKGGDYFVLGDNRNFSFDSRSWGSLSKNEIVGLVRLRLWPINEVKAFEAPNYAPVAQPR
ncbi:MAG: signal peptidase I [Parcubacteria group bacterium]|nr:signal peptidase I [Parcubacteria group bacterium]